MTSVLSWLIRPLLRASLIEYRRDVEQAAFPIDPPEPVAGDPPDRLLFVGDVAVMGYGVLLQGMAVCTRVAHAVAAHRGRGSKWGTIAAADLTLARTAKLLSGLQPDLDLVVLMVGVPDVLLATSPDSWARSLERAVANARQVNPRARVIVAGMPPMADFRVVPAVVHRILTARVNELNSRSAALAGKVVGVRYVGFPAAAPSDLMINDELSWAKLHEAWASAIIPVALEVLDTSPSALSDHSL